MKKIFITGGAGYLGHVLIKKLIDKGYFVTIVDPLIFGQQLYKELFNHPNVDFQIGVAEDIYVLEKSLKDIYAVIHLSGLSNDPSCELNEDLTRKSNIDASKILVNLCKEVGVKRFIYASSCSVYGFTGDEIVNENSPLNPLTAYSKSKVASEELVLKEKTDDFVVVCLRKSTLYGPSKRMRFDLVVNTMTGTAISEGKIIINGGEQWRPFLHVSDAADAYIHMIETDKNMINGQTYNVGCNEDNHMIRDIAKKVANVIPNTEVEMNETPDKRSYLVNFDKIYETGWKTKLTVEDGILGVKKLFDTGFIKNFRDINYFNIKRMITYLNI